jgi:signal transduction histidine kinase/ActR/RegA family two-component response regulator
MTLSMGGMAGPMVSGKKQIGTHSQCSNGSEDWPDLDREEARKRRLYAILSIPGIIFLLIFAIYDFYHGIWVGGCIDAVAAVMLLAGIFYLRYAGKAMALYRINTLALVVVMLYWVMDGGTGGEKVIWAFIFPLIAYFMLGPVEGTIWNAATLGCISLMFFAKLPLHVYPYLFPLKIRYICVYLVISILTYSYESFRKQSWESFFKQEMEKKELREKLACSQKMEALGLLAGGVAHDLNNVMFGLVSYPDYLLSKTSPDNTLYEPLKTIRESGQKAAAIVEELLTLARRGVTSTKVLNLNVLIHEYLASPEFKVVCEVHPKVEVVPALSDELKPVDGSALHLKKCVMNLVSNSAEALPDGGRVVVSTANSFLDKPVRGYPDVVQGAYVLLQVEDKGIGISQEDLPHIFEPFYTKKIMGRSGTGLGMAVVWGTVQDHQGFIDVQSMLGQGTVVRIFLPASSREPTDDNVQEVRKPHDMGNGETILIVDDVPEQRTLAGQILKDLGYRVHAAESGEAAVDFVRERRVDLILLDMIMEPGIDGLETYRRILRIHPDQKAILVSGFSESERVKAAQKLGAGAYVKKPYVLESLGAAIRTELEKKPL